MTDARSNVEREQVAFATYWEARRVSVLRARANLWERRLNKTRVLEDHSCFFTASILLGESIELLMMDENNLAARMLECAEYYLQVAQERDDLAAYGRAGQEDMGRSQRLKEQVLVRWLRGERLNLADLGLATAMKAEWLNGVFSSPDWRRTGFELADWMVDYIVVNAPDEAVLIYKKYWPRTGSTRTAWSREPENTLFLVADCLARRDAVRCRSAEEQMDAFYHAITDWGPHFDERAMFHEQRLLYAFIRGKFFKGEEDPLRLIEMMKFSA